jgi:NADPH2:quinone reductase
MDDMKAVRIHTQGDPSVLSYEEISAPEPGIGQVLLKIKYAGVNFTDVYTRSGLYPADLPLTLGCEASGEVIKTGPDVDDVRVGEAVASVDVLGSYAESAVVPASRLVKIRNLGEKLAAAVILQGLTAHYLAYDTFPVKAGMNVLIHAGAGGVGLLLIQMTKKLGAHVMVTTSTDQKASLAKEAGADDVIVYTREDFPGKLRAITKEGVNVVYDSVGKDTFEKSLRCLAPRGYLVLFGNSSGFAPPIQPDVLKLGSLYLTRPILKDYIATPAELQARAGEVFRMVESGEIKVHISDTFKLYEATEAHRLLEGRLTTGKILLVP